jgi:PAS domain S-box-containing protein
LGCIFGTGSALAQDARIFILHSYHQEYPWTNNENRGFTQTLADKFPSYEINISTEYLDTKRVSFNKEYQEFFFHYLQEKFILYTPDVIFCSDDNALTFLLQFKERLFGNVPVVFCGVNNLDVEKGLNRQEYTGVFEKKEIAPNLALLKKINPQPGNIIFLGDDSSTNQAIEQKIKADMASLFPKQKYSVLSSNNLSYLVNQVQLGKAGVIFLTTIGGIKDEQNLVVPLQKTIASIVRAGNFTVISMEDVYLEEGVLGGYVTSGFAQGKEAANLTVQILQGSSPASIPLINVSPNEYMFNYPQLKKFGLTTSQLPAKSVILNRPQSLYDQYKYRIWSAVLFLIFQTFAIFVLLKNINKRKSAESALQQAGKVLEQKVLERTSELSTLNKNLEAEKNKIQKYLDIAGVIFVIISPDKEVVLINKKGCEILDTPEEEILGKNWFDTFLPERFRQGAAAVFDKLMSGEEQLVEYYKNPALTKNGNERVIFWHNALLRDDNGNIEGVLSSGEDITEQEQLEQQLRQSQKMEAIGTLAGGIAHDFNNILTAIIGYTELARYEQSAESPIKTDLDEVLNACNRAKELVQQILTFGRKGDQQLKPLRIQLIIKEALKLLRASLPTTIKMTQNIDPDCEAVFADPTEIHQLLMNLCTNAYHAMRESGGLLSVSLYPVALRKEDLGHKIHLDAGLYLKLEINDTGTGMPEDVQNKIFDPYFTTKEKGEGTGLGLSVVHGIVTRLHGDISVHSEPGKGTTFIIYLPTVPPSSADASPDLDSVNIPKGNERILLVDDDVTIAQLNSKTLAGLGYEVTSFTNSEDTLHEFQKRPDNFDLVITDMTMPDMTGAELAVQILKIKPGMPIILCTGYSEQINEEKAKSLGIRAFIMKPVKISKLTETIRKVLD